MSRVIQFAADTRPQCKALRTGKYYHDTPGVAHQCCNRAKYLVDGTPLCGKHAGAAALKILTEGASTPMSAPDQVALLDQHTEPREL